MSYNPETGLYTGYIYCIENTVNGKKYIGQTIQTIKKRWYEHVHKAKNSAGKNMAIAKAIIKYGKESFDIKPVHEITCETIEELHEELNKLEIDTISDYNTYIHTGYGYNICSGGYGGNGRTYKKITSYDMDGNKLHDFHRYNEVAMYYNICSSVISKICNGKQYNYNNQYVFRQDGEPFDKYPVIDPKYNYGIYQFDTDGNLIAKYNNLWQAYEATGIGFESLEIVDNPYVLRGGYWWSYGDKFNYSGFSLHERKVDVYDKETLKYIDTFNSIKKCGEYFNIPHSLIGANCRGIQKTCRNYIFRYHGDPLDKYDYKTKNRCSGPFGYKVNKYTKDGTFICTYDTLQKACKDMGLSFSGGIGACCRGDQKTAYGFKWKLL